jgi:hypothetical protein
MITIVANLLFLDCSGKRHYRNFECNVASFFDAMPLINEIIEDVQNRHDWDFVMSFTHIKKNCAFARAQSG